MRLIAAMSFVVLLAIASSARAQGERINVQGFERTYLLLGQKKPGRLPLILALHGNRGSGAQFARYAGWDELVRQENILVALPDGLNRAWADGRPQAQFRGKSPPPGTDDVAFLTALIAHLVEQGYADPARVYITGVSNGGIMAYRMLCERADLFAGAAPIIANFPDAMARACRPSRIVPLLVMNGTADRFAPFASQPGVTLGHEDAVAFWRGRNGCGEIDARRTLPDRDPTDGSTVAVTSYACPANARVLSYVIAGGGHQFPSIAKAPVLENLLGPRNRDIEGSRTLWDFFRRP
ncbi:MAG: prolyl oligopeptidase family serine peptidase [Hyphomicrobiales bacterium]|nr:prolyl oligopeptidase family serine peptidase [Hyphomicrobiales bacterium]OQW82433.1 MAG: hypothetical protein BVN31_08530 [Proteobacteria bacterium ST_bin15]